MSGYVQHGLKEWLPILLAWDWKRFVVKCHNPSLSLSLLLRTCNSCRDKWCAVARGNEAAGDVRSIKSLLGASCATHERAILRLSFVQNSITLKCRNLSVFKGDGEDCCWQYHTARIAIKTVQCALLQERALPDGCYAA